jgi:hypothetical protein
VNLGRGPLRLSSGRLSRFLLLAVAPAALVLTACRTPAPVPEAAAHSYARALREGRLDDAWAQVALSQREAGLDREAFAQRYAEPRAREARAEEVLGALPALELRAGPLALVREEGAWWVREPLQAPPGAREALEAFIDAAQAGDFERAWTLLAAPLRARYSPSRLEDDFRKEPLSRERLERARAALGTPPVLEGDEARFELGEGRAVRLVREGDVYRVAALE